MVVDGIVFDKFILRDVKSMSRNGQVATDVVMDKLSSSDAQRRNLHIRKKFVKENLWATH